MPRGEYKNLIQHHGYQNAEKSWLVELQHCQIYWYELLANTSKLFDNRKIIRDELNELRKNVEESLDKRFIYFIFSRPKVRFDINKQPRNTLFRKRLKVYLQVGHQKKNVCIALDIRRNDGKPVEASVDDKFIIMSIDDEDQVCMSIHDFLLNFNINLGMSSEVHYVGYTKNPHNRPTNGAHAGLSKILHNVSNEYNDVFVAFNLFKVTTEGRDEDKKIDFLIANAMTDEVNADDEGLIIEKSFINYFKPHNQDANQQNEERLLVNLLSKIKTSYRINSLSFHYEIDTPESDYFIFYSNSVSPNIRHLFTIKENNNELELG